MLKLHQWLVPTGAHPSVLLLLKGRALRAFADGYVAVLLPAYLIALGLGTWEVGLLATATLLGSAVATIAIGAAGHKFRHGNLLMWAAALMAATGFAFAAGSTFWPLLLVAFVGTLNPSSGDVSLFLPLEHTRIAEAAEGEAQNENRRDEREQADAAGAHRGQLVIGAETAEDEQRGGEQSHRQREDEDERNQQRHGLRDAEQRGLVIEQQREDFLHHVAQQQHKDEHGDAEQQRRHNLPGEIKVQGFHRCARRNYLFPGRGLQPTSM